MRGRCDACRQAGDRQRGSGRDRGWSPQWRRFRGWYLRLHPVCECANPEHCPDGCTQPSSDVNHLGDASRVTPDAYDPAKVQALCHSCHSWYTARHQPGGFLNQLGQQ